jgi:NAD(P)-dependent dehydrogenase (short-subunit alcohol dehydrogenase family)
MKRVCLLTGASGLLGTAFLERYAERYHVIAVHHRNPIQFATQQQQFIDPLAPQREMAVNAHAVHAIQADIALPLQIDRLIDEVVERCGQVDLLLNVAALRGWANLLDPHALDGVDRLMDVNVLAPLRLCVGLARRLWIADPDDNVRANRNIINLSSTAGLFVYPDYGQSMYAMSKAALNHLTYHLASEFWHIGIRVNGIAPDTFPGRVPTDAVLDEIIALDSSDRTGQVVPLYSGGST